MKYRKITALVAAFMMIFSSSCTDDETGGTKTAKKKDLPAIATTQAEKGSLIRRKLRVEETPMGEDGTWTVLVYMCGSDLESENGAGSLDLSEMMDASESDNVQFVVQTGGASEWDCEVDPDACERYLIQNGEAELVYESDEVDMGETESLEDFVRWGIYEYPAANMGLIFWDHGSGCVNGVCFDEKYDESSLLLKEIDAALYNVYDEMTEPFEFIGFDACLMSCAETAAVMATHARYMVASQESEPGGGWNYTKIGSYLAEHPDCSGDELGRQICDSFYSDCELNEEENCATLSVIDLSKIDAFIEQFDKFSKDIYALTDKASDFSAFARNVSKAENFGGNNKASGYTNMVDIGALIEAGDNCSANASAALNVLDDAVIYTKNGSDHTDASGLSVYYPLRLTGSQELSIFKDIALSSYYLGVVDKVAYGAANDGFDGYDNSTLISSFCNDWSTDSYTVTDGVFSYIPSDSSEWSYADDYAEGSGNVTFDKEPYFDKDGVYCFKLSEKSLGETDSIQAAIYMIDEDFTEMIELGYSGDVYGDFDTGEFYDGFDGLWFTLPDGQYLAAYIEDYCDGYDIYTSPIKLNGEETNLRFAYYYEVDGEPTVEIIDVWDGIDDDGSVSRRGKTLKNGDKITPLYYTYSLGDDEEYYYEGDEYKYTDKTRIKLDELIDGDYLYSFIINDIYGNYSETDAVLFTIDGEDVYFEKLE